MALRAPCNTLLAKSRYRMEVDSVTVKFLVSTSGNDDVDERCVYWIVLENSGGDVVMKETHSDFIAACEIYERLKKTLDFNAA